MNKVNFIWFVILIILNSCSYCDFIQEQESKKFHGIVIEKKTFEWDRGKKILTIKSGVENQKYYFPTDFSYNKFWNFIEEGDSISKENDSKLFQLYKGDSLIWSIEIDFGCTE